jgi:predicted DNA-binding protein with PD1-like motif
VVSNDLNDIIATILGGIIDKKGTFVTSTVKHAHVVTSNKQSTVLKGHIFLVQS